MRASTKQNSQCTSCSDFSFCHTLQKLDCFPTGAGEVQRWHLSSWSNIAIAPQETALEARLACRLTAAGWEGTGRPPQKLGTAPDKWHSHTEHCWKGWSGSREYRFQTPARNKRAQAPPFPNTRSTCPPPFPRLGLTGQIWRHSTTVALTQGQGLCVQQSSRTLIFEESLLQGSWLQHTHQAL